MCNGIIFSVVQAVGYHIKMSLPKLTNSIVAMKNKSCCTLYIALCAEENIQQKKIAEIIVTVREKLQHLQLQFDTCSFVLLSISFLLRRCSICAQQIFPTSKLNERMGRTR